MKNHINFVRDKTLQVCPPSVPSPLPSSVTPSIYRSSSTLAQILQSAKEPLTIVGCKYAASRLSTRCVEAVMISGHLLPLAAGRDD